ncbi:hypothetical protein JG688_00012116, partial [Phytophthora aleatoria]
EDRDIVLDRLQKEVADVPVTHSHARRGVNQVARAVARREVKVVVFACNPESMAFGHLPFLCRLHQVPICDFQAPEHGGCRNQSADKRREEGCSSHEATVTDRSGAEEDRKYRSPCNPVMLSPTKMCTNQSTNLPQRGLYWQDVGGDSTSRLSSPEL